jgi:hypothetical protein
VWKNFYTFDKFLKRELLFFFDFLNAQTEINHKTAATAFAFAISGNQNA